MKHISIFTLFALLFVQKLNAQKSLTVGDSLPVFHINKVINSDKQNINTSNFKNQLLIIDFWSIYCSSCVEALPRMESLQKQFGSKIRILPITEESEELVTTFWNTNKITKNLTINYVVEDKILASYFKHLGVPHEVWIYNGKVIAITDSYYVDANNITKVLTGQLISWPIKYDFYNYDGNKLPIFQIDTNQIDINSTPLIYAAISDYKEGVNSIGLSGGSGIVRDQAKKTLRAFFLNQPIYNSYFLNWIKITKSDSLKKPGKRGINPNEIIWEVLNKSKYIHNPDSTYLAEWIRKNGICFESLYPDTGQTNKEVYKSIISDLNRLLGLNVRWEKRKDTVLILNKINQNSPTKGSLSQYSKNKDAQKRNKPPITRISLASLIYKLNQEEKNPYVFDESGFKSDTILSLQLPSFTDIPMIRKVLAIYGLDLIKKERLVDKFVFTEINGGLFFKKN